MVERIDFNATVAEFDRIVNSFGANNGFTNLNDSFGDDGFRDFVDNNSIILNDMNNGGMEGLEPTILVVNTFQDQNDGNASNGLSLRDAIIIAHRNPTQPYIIQLPAGTYNLTIEGNEDFRFQEQVGSSADQQGLEGERQGDSGDSEENGEENNNGDNGDNGEEAEQAPDSVLGLFDNTVLRSGDLDISVRVTIIGEDPNNTIIDASALGDRIFDIKEGGNLILENVTLQNGITQGTFPEGGPVGTRDPDSFLGGAIRVLQNGQLTLNNTIIQENISAWDGFTSPANVNGGAIANLLGTVEINNSIIRNNQSDVNAGAIFNNGAMTINNSAIIGNDANIRTFYVDQVEGGGGIWHQGGSLTILNSTIAQNRALLAGPQPINPSNPRNVAFAGGGGILIDLVNPSDPSQVTIINSTIVDNDAELGSGILSNGDVEGILLRNSIVARNTGSPDIEGFFSVGSAFNLVGNGNGLIVNGVNGNIAGGLNNPVDPLLGAFDQRGFYPLREGSPAINAGNNIFIEEIASIFQEALTDQRGLTRIVNGNVDIGSFEFGADNVQPEENIVTPIETANNIVPVNKGIGQTFFSFFG
ncbi:Polymorphic membrane protein Chlamydia [Cyanobacterium stanieri PCC 7202]|uniref:Polymorphic membrane protein Chlamydia n=1 Tax=Cyanobacterium stanieri (strain ATCC 29140 / PCC 7202) TaxID=292563 RepID=K9YQV1_CYASC|nr:Polymorphic membrane protein Chlamydia [Cyanobacterium stanieri PCC 7202]